MPVVAPYRLFTVSRNIVFSPLSYSRLLYERVRVMVGFFVVFFFSTNPQLIVRNKRTRFYDYRIWHFCFSHRANANCIQRVSRISRKYKLIGITVRCGLRSLSKYVIDGNWLYISSRLDDLVSKILVIGLIRVFSGRFVIVVVVIGVFFFMQIASRYL